MSHLVRLARKGAYAVEATDVPIFHVFSPRNAFAKPIAVLPVDVLRRALALNLVMAEQGSEHLKLSSHGRRCVRRHLSEQGRNVKKPPTTAAPEAVAGRPVTPGKERIEGPLAWLRRRRDRQGRPLISQIQFDAGERLAADYGRAHLEARITANWSTTAPRNAGARGPARIEISDAAMAARDRVYAAIAAVGPEVGALLVDVCCHDIGLEAAERARGWPVRSGKVVLDMALTHLARHYGMLREERQERPQRPRRWSDDAFTPTLRAWA